ncbi:universal stress protein [Actinomycetospora cinnamomea]|uniref:Nucleotide-binding universal stress UspA family protein n=1 Tax=Actinomycetospora cinnamomea TaxID=663609 RepID=A0A2U1F255_9PSEU|nr:universal stress protein [Actinomycetospora cinnamomea]PVZ06265.1 nucleotide-binding universal stress UspA family protein [Actinomycetospora cinnamomea]
MDAAGTERGRIVVGIDGSTHADDALRWAVGEAARRGLAVRAVVAHEPPDAWMSPYGVPLLADSDEIRQAVEDSARTRVEAVRRELDEALRAVPVDVVAVTGPVGWVLEQEARGAELLVVGHRGRGALRSTLLGSVGLSVVLRAPCPVTVVPAPRRAAEVAADEEVALAGPLPVGPIA